MPLVLHARLASQNSCRPKYVGLLEADVARLRAENRALTNSLLGTAGFPPVDISRNEAASLPRLRKRSWHQIQAWAKLRLEGCGPDRNSKTAEQRQRR